jgi:hypothetical protein
MCRYKFLLSASFDHNAIIWSPLVGTMVYKLKGHATPLVGVKHIPDSPEVCCCSFCHGALSLPVNVSAHVYPSVEQLVMYHHSWMLFANDDSVVPVAWACVVGVCCQVITASVDGQVMVWDLRMLRCVQTFNDSSSVGLDGGMNCFETCPSRKQIVCAGKSLSVYRQVRAVLCTFFVPSSTPVHRPSTLRVGPSGSALVALRPPWLAMCYALLCGVFVRVCGCRAWLLCVWQVMDPALEKHTESDPVVAAAFSSRDLVVFVACGRSVGVMSSLHPARARTRWTALCQCAPLIVSTRHSPPPTCTRIRDTHTLLTYAQISVWSALTGALVRLYRDIAACEITSFSLDSFERRYIVGFSDGSVKVCCVVRLCGANCYLLHKACLVGCALLVFRSSSCLAAHVRLA